MRCNGLWRETSCYKTVIWLCEMALFHPVNGATWLSLCFNPRRKGEEAKQSGVLWKGPALGRISLEQPGKTTCGQIQLWGTGLAWQQLRGSLLSVKLSTYLASLQSEGLMGWSTRDEALPTCCHCGICTARCCVPLQPVADAARPTQSCSSKPHGCSLLGTLWPMPQLFLQPQVTRRVL